MHERIGTKDIGDYEILVSANLKILDYADLPKIYIALEKLIEVKLNKNFYLLMKQNQFLMFGINRDIE